MVREDADEAFLDRQRELLPLIVLSRQPSLPEPDEYLRSILTAISACLNGSSIVTDALVRIKKAYWRTSEDRMVPSRRCLLYGVDLGGYGELGRG